MNNINTLNAHQSTVSHAARTSFCASTHVAEVLKADEIISASNYFVAVVKEWNREDVKNALNKIFEIIKSANRGEIQMYFIGLRSALEKRFSEWTLTEEDRQLLQGELDYIAGVLSKE